MGGGGPHDGSPHFGAREFRSELLDRVQLSRGQLARGAFGLHDGGAGLETNRANASLAQRLVGAPKDIGGQERQLGQPGASEHTESQDTVYESYGLGPSSKRRTERLEGAKDAQQLFAVTKIQALLLS